MSESIPLPFGDTGVLDGPGGLDGLDSTGMGARMSDDDFIAPNDQRSSSSSERSTVQCESSTLRDDLWDRGRLGALTYCFGLFSDPELEAAVREATEESLWEYELAADVHFVHRQELDGPGCSTDADVVFVIRQGVNPDDCNAFSCPLASAFFPSDAEGEETQEALFFDDILTNEEFSLKGIVQHEFGHVLGLFHEHARYVQDDGVLDIGKELACTLSSGGDALWRGVTLPDPDSIMGYPYCRGTPGGAVQLSASDRLGLRSLYNLPALSEQSLDNNETSDILWYRAGDSVAVVWGGVATVGEVTFVESSFCWSALPLDMCEGPSPDEWKPIPLRAGDRSNVLMYGPGAVPDRLVQFQDLGEAPIVSAVANELRTAVPHTGDLVGSSQEDDVLFVLPGPDNSDWGLAGGTTSFMIYESSTGADGFNDVAVGRFSSDLAVLGDQLIWYSERDSAWTMTSRTDAGLVDQSVDPGACGLSGVGELNPIVGNFDGDPEDEILWYAVHDGSAVLWPDVINCALGQETYTVGGRAKAHPGDFDGDGRLDILWERPMQGSELWLFPSVAVPVVLNVDVPEGALPLAGDFNGDSCDDVIWHRAHSGESLKWRSSCDGTFVSSQVATPQGASAVGYRFGQGRAYRGAGLPR